MDAVSEYRPAVQALVARILRRGREDPDVEDCTHEVFRRALEGLGRLHEGHAIRPWLLGIARHVALDNLRSRHRARLRQAHSSSASLDGVDELVAPGSSPETLAAHAEQVARLRTVLHQLPEHQLECLRLFHVEGLGYREISERLEVPVGTVGTWVLRARQSLATTLRSAPVATPVPDPGGNA